jgi:hypothetical protein
MIAAKHQAAEQLRSDDVIPNGTINSAAQVVAADSP